MICVQSDREKRRVNRAESQWKASRAKRFRDEFESRLSERIRANGKFSLRFRNATARARVRPAATRLTAEISNRKSQKCRSIFSRGFSRFLGTIYIITCGSLRVVSHRLGAVLLETRLRFSRRYCRVRRVAVTRQCALLCGQLDFPAFARSLESSHFA